MNKIIKTQTIWLSATWFIVLSTLLLQNGCTRFESVADQPTLQQQCCQSDVLYTDLAKPKKNRRYVLPNGQVCHIEVKL